MKAKRRKFTQEFKDEAVQLYFSSGKPQTEIAGELGIGPNSLARWVKNYERQMEKQRNPKESVEQENERLRRELSIVTQERDILKKSLGIVSRA